MSSQSSENPTEESFHTMEVWNFYQFTPIADLGSIREQLKFQMLSFNLRGSILLAPEGFNCMLSGFVPDLERFLLQFKELLELPVQTQIFIKRSFATAHPFKRAKVRLKKELVPLGRKVSMEKVGIYVEPEEWNTLLSNPEVLVIDTRNQYEVDFGSFQNAMNPTISQFNDLPGFVEQSLADKKNSKVAMFCTGGIRCEKFSAYLLENGFSEVYHLKGGILNYLDKTPAEQSKWQGQCFVFDERVVL